MYILPEPKHLLLNDSNFLLPYDSEIMLSYGMKDVAYNAASLLQKEISTRLGYTQKIKRSFTPEKGQIAFIYREMQHPQEYELTIDSEGIVIAAQEDAAILYGVQTLRQIIRQEAAILPCLRISDYPDICNRGFFHDATRGRIQHLSRYKQLAETAAFYKLNQLQLYVEHTYLFENFSEVCRDDTPLTPEDIMELDSYCAELGIDLIPSLASFGHLDKVLKTKSFSKLCELENADLDIFTFEGRMQHHTLDVSNEESFLLVLSMLDEFIPLFRSHYFNINGDETFDLGKGRSKALADKTGLHELYVSIILRICSYIRERGKQPMFWGDIILESPELIRELPEDVICLNWGYSEIETADNARKMYEAGACQYLCPGVHGWRHLINRLDLAYENVTRMCRYAHQYNAAGVLNTDWGDYGHVSDPDFSIPGLIYGAAFSWNLKQEDKQDINKKISFIEYGDMSGRFTDIVSELSMQEAWTWNDTVSYKEAFDRAQKKTDRQIRMDAKELPVTENKSWFDALQKADDEQAKIMKESNVYNGRQANQRIDELTDALYGLLHNVDASKRPLIHRYLVSSRLQKIINMTAMSLAANIHHYPIEVPKASPAEIAKMLELTFMQYKELWRESSRESELYRVQDVIFYYADLLRDM